MHTSSTLAIPPGKIVPHHIAIIMDGNGRWAKRRMLPRIAGHKSGVEAVRTVVKLCIEHDVKFLTLFAFSSENWRRPGEEVSLLMQLFVMALEQEVDRLDQAGVRLKVIGDLSRFDAKLIALIEQAEAQTCNNHKLTLTIAANYGGRWDILQAVNRLLKDRPGSTANLSEADLAPYLSMAYAPEPDLFIRTGGEQRVSNFLLWQLAYTELYFTDTLWPDFDQAAFETAVKSFRQRERRFGRTSDQLQAGTESVRRALKGG